MSIQIVEIAQPSVIDTVAVAQPSTVALVEIRQGPAGTGGSGSATWGGITGTLSDQTDLQTALNLKAPLASPALTGTPTAPTAVTTTSTTQLATTAFVQQELASGVAVAKNLEFLAHNGTGVTITKGSIVYINGAVSGNPRITLAQANNDTNSARTIGFAKADITNGANGFVISEGELDNVSTVDAVGIIGAGNQIFLSPTTPGAFTRTKPSAPNHLVYVGVVTRASTGANLDGRILVGIQNGYELDELHDVAISSPAAKQVIKRNAGNTLWVNEAIVSADVSDATSVATANTLVLRDGSGGAAFVGATFSGLLDAGDFSANGTTGEVTFGSGSQILFDGISYSYGTGAASAHRIALGAGTTGSELFGAADLTAARATLQRRVFVKPTDSTKNNDAVIAADSYFTGIPVEAGVYRIYVELMLTTNTTAQGTVRLSHPANARPANYVSNIVFGSGVSGVTQTATGSTTTLGAYNVNGTRAMHGYLDFTFGASGTLSVEWAQSTATAVDTILRAGSYLIIEKLS
jgi:hypothetical protein